MGSIPSYTRQYHSIKRLCIALPGVLFLFFVLSLQDTAQDTPHDIPQVVFAESCINGYDKSDDGLGDKLSGKGKELLLKCYLQGNENKPCGE